MDDTLKELKELIDAIRNNNKHTEKVIPDTQRYKDAVRRADLRVFKAQDLYLEATSNFDNHPEDREETIDRVHAELKGIQYANYIERCICKEEIYKWTIRG